MQIAIIGTGYVGLVTGVSLSEIGHHVVCIDKEKDKIQLLKSGELPIYEPGLKEMASKNVENGLLTFSNELATSCSTADVIYIAVGTPQNKDGTVDLTDIKRVAVEIARSIVRDTVVVTKSTVPVGTNDHLKQLIEENLVHPISVHMVSNPEFLREGSAIQDTFHGDRIVIGADNQYAGDVIEAINSAFQLPIVRTDIRDAEMIKYASNAFLATKISFINEIANICEKVGVNVEKVVQAMGMDKRIGNQFLQAGIGYGGSCFPKDTKALIQLSGNVDHNFQLLKSVVEVNNNQQVLLVKKAKERLGNLNGKWVALLGLAFKPNTDDMREAASIVVANHLLDEGANIIAYDPAAMNHAKRRLPDKVTYGDSIETTLTGADLAFILTEWEEFKRIELSTFHQLMNKPIVFDGRNCFDLERVKEENFDYYSIGRPTIMR